MKRGKTWRSFLKRRDETGRAINMLAENRGSPRSIRRIGSTIRSRFSGLGEKGYVRKNAGKSRIAENAQQDTRNILEAFPPDAARNPDPLIGKTLIDRYTVIRSLGRTSLGISYLGADRKGDKGRVALHIPDSAATRKMRDLREEAAPRLRELKHPNICRFIGLESIPGIRIDFLITQYVEGQPLIDAARTMGIRDLCSVLIQICQGLSFLNRKGTVHGDLRPGNLIVDRNDLRGPWLWITETGFAQFNASIVTYKTAEEVSFLAPESIQGARPDIRSDLYSLGAILYLLVTGSNPFPGDTPGEVIRGHLTIAPRAPSASAWGAPSWLDRLILSLLSKDPLKRPQSPEHVIETILRESHIRAPVYISDSLSADDIRLIGRGAELDRIFTLLVGTDPRHPRSEPPTSYIHIHGETGVGKTRFIKALTAKIHAEDIPVLAPCCKSPSWDPYGAFRQLFELLTPVIRQNNLDDDFRRELGWFFRLADETFSPPSGVPARRDREWFGDLNLRILTFLGKLAQKTNFFVILDDMHKLPQEAGFLISAIVRSIQGISFIAISSQSVPKQFDSFPSLHLQPLSREDQEMLAIRLSFLREGGLKKVTKPGNPLFLKWIDGFQIDAPMQSWEDLIGACFDKAAPTERSIMEILAVFEQPMPANVLKSVLIAQDNLCEAAISRLKDLDWINAGEMLTDCGFRSPDVGSQSGGEEKRKIENIAIAHDVLREWIIELLPEDAKKKYHIKIAEALIRLFPEEHPWRNVLIAENLMKSDSLQSAAHWLERLLQESGTHGNQPLFYHAMKNRMQAAPSGFSGADFIEIGRLSEAMGEYGEASAYYSQAVSKENLSWKEKSLCWSGILRAKRKMTPKSDWAAVIPEADRSLASAPFEDRVGWDKAKIRASAETGDPADVTAQLNAIREKYNEIASGEMPDILLLEGELHLRNRNLAKAEEALKRVITFPDSDSTSLEQFDPCDLRSARLLLAEALIDRDTGAARKLLELVVEESTKIGALDDLSRALVSLARINGFRGRYEHAERLLDRGELACRAAGNRDRMARIEIERALFDMNQCEYGKAYQRLFQRQPEETDRSPELRFDFYLARAGLLTAIGDLQRAGNESDRSLRSMREAPNPSKSVRFGLFEGRLLLKEEKCDAARSRWEDALAQSLHIGDLRVAARILLNLAELEILENNKKRGWELLERAKAFLPGLRELHLWLTYYRLRAECDAGAGMAAKLHLLYRALRIANAGGDLWGSALVLAETGRIRGQSGLLQHERGDMETAIRALEEIASRLPENMRAFFTSDPGRGKIYRRYQSLTGMGQTPDQASPSIADGRREGMPFPGFIAKSRKMEPTLELMHRVSKTLVTVLVQGETGTGKEVVAQAIHQSGPRAKMSMERINCAALPETLLEAELFGYKKGAFTGADKDREGLFVMADGGTLFLDEIGDMSPRMQVALLRALQDGEIRPLGGGKQIKVDVRIIAATNKNLFELVKTNRFREDLYYRIAVVLIDVPPLRERTDDIPFLVDFLLKSFGKEHNKSYSVDLQTIRQLMNLQWPGNIRQLQNMIEKAIVLSGKSDISGILSELAAVEQPAAKEIIAPERLPDMLELNPRQTALFQRVQRGRSFSVGDYLSLIDEKVSRKTLQTDLKDLVLRGLMIQEGGGRSSRYRWVVR